ncbi:MAG: hypothetical protein COU30_01770, partial [Candidatus Magasanikbacteria bacterium CG10_big_fil_rev_8_21_14_0_10_38_6]
MLFEKGKDISLAPYSPHQSGLFAKLKYTKDTGIKHAQIIRNSVLFWGKPLTNYHITLRRYRQYLRNFQFIGSLIFTVGFL